MAITNNKNESAPLGLLNAGAARLAGVLSILLAAASIAAIILYLLYLEQGQPALAAVAVLKIAFLAVVVVAGIQLIRQRSWAQRFLLIVWLAGLVGAVCTSAAVMLSGESPDWWPIDIAPLAILAPLIALEAIVALSLVAASTGQSRLRYATNVTIAVAAALALIVVVNMLSQDWYARKDVETLGRFSLSQRTKRILDTIDQPVRLTCVYTDTEDKAATADRRSRVMELLAEMREQNDQMEVQSISTDTGKAELVERLRDKLAVGAQKHDEVLKEFQASSEAIVEALTQQQQLWNRTAGQSYLDQWGLTAEVARLLGNGAQEIQKTSDKVSAGLAGAGLPDYEQLTSDVEGQLTTASETLKAVSDRMEQIAEIAPAVQANKAGALEAARRSVESVEAMADALGPDDEEPVDPAKTLEELCVAGEAASKQIQIAARTINEIAGRELSGLAQASQAWMAKSGGRKITMPGGVVLQERNTLTDVYRNATATVMQLKIEADAVRQAANVEHQAKVVRQLRGNVESIRKWLDDTQQEVRIAIETLSEVDAPTRELLKSSTGGSAFEQISGPVEKLLEAIKDLPDIEGGTLSDDVTQKNIVIVETESKTSVVDFESVWPLAVKPQGYMAPTGPDKRDFNGDSAISSEILTMTEDPFAQVLITYYKPDAPREMERMISGSINPDKLSKLTERLEEANFEVERWNLKDARPEPEQDRRQVLLVLPPVEVPPMSMSGREKPIPFGDEHLSKLRAVIDEGTPAIFLALWEPPRQMSFFGPAVSPPYLLGEYLEEDWGIEVLTDYLIVPAVADPDVPGKLRPDIIRMNYFPLSSFSDHVIGKNLQGQRMLWQQLAIVRQASPPESVQVDSLLTVTEAARNVWATRRLDELIMQFQTAEGSAISPAYEAGDLATPFDVAVVARRSEGEQKSPARIVVLGLAGGLRDSCLDQRVHVLGPDGSLSQSDPPSANADPVINSAYWLVGRDGYIARGPAQIKPIAGVPVWAMWFWQGVFILGLPLSVLVVGGVILLVRRI